MIPGWFRSMRSFGQKVTWLVTLTSGVAIVAVCFTLAIVDHANFRRDRLSTLEAQTEIVAMNSSAPLAFGDRFNAAEALQAFRARPGVALATIYDVHGRPFASYRRQEGVAPATIDTRPPSGLVRRWVTHVAPIQNRGQSLGRIEVLFDTSSMQTHLLRTLVFSSVVSLVAVLLVYLFSLRINRLLVKPIALLSRTARQVSVTKDYSLRARKVSEDELGVFTDAFNEMLGQIQKQDLEIQASRAEALHASQLKDEFLATLSHELRTPMTPILGWAQILQRMARDHPQVVQAAEVIERNARAQNKIIDDLLDMSRIISGKVRLDIQRIDLAAVVHEALDTVAAAANARGIRLEPVLEPGAGLCQGDPHRLQQVFWNLLSNAIKFTPAGGQVEISMRREAGDIEVRVTDTGQGIASEFLPHVFERFRQADSSNTRRHAGLGLGLAIVKQLVELHGGTVGVDSPGSGLGSTFTVVFPTVPVLPVESSSGLDRDLVADSQATPDPVGLAGVTLLLVDDEPDARDLIENLLRDGGAHVISAASVPEALAALDRFRPDVLVSDIGMPGQNGYELIRRVRALTGGEGGSLPAIALTAFARPEDRLRALEAGFQMHVCKPVDQAELLAAVSYVLVRPVAT